LPIIIRNPVPLVKRETPKRAGVLPIMVKRETPLKAILTT
jgi:hypothetical protein